MNKSIQKIRPIFTFTLITVFTTIRASVYDISQYGAINDGNTINTKAIQQAIDD